MPFRKNISANWARVTRPAAK